MFVRTAIYGVLIGYQPVLFDAGQEPAYQVPVPVAIQAEYMYIFRVLKILFLMSVTTCWVTIFLKIFFQAVD